MVVGAAVGLALTTTGASALETAESEATEANGFLTATAERKWYEL